ncbi:uncharacterized protein LOC134244236 [Saccostrea cucullata]|uniref:uncharacterized protein LOC134244236 n=1 Tax=Saccostrea cuccullata TaxID=36930 RepID=UPI002ED276CA
MEEKETDYCKLCDPSVSTSSWTNRDTEKFRQEFAAIQVSKSKSDDGYSSELVTLLAATCGVIGFFLLVTLFYICKQKERLQKRKEGGLYNVYKEPTHDIPQTSMMKEREIEFHNPAYAEEKSKL